MANKRNAKYKRKAVLRQRRKRSSGNTFLYIAVSLLILTFIIGVAIVCIIAETGGDTSDNSEAYSEQSDNTVSKSENPNTVSKPDISKPEESDNSSETVSDNTSEISDNSDISDDSDVSDEEQLGTTEAYEKYIGVDYAIDMTEYEKYVAPENAQDFLFLVNPANPLPKDFVPKDLVKCTNIRAGRPPEWSKIDRTANYALEAFLLEAKHYGFDDITVTNAYRSYQSQNSLFNNYVSSDQKADYYCENCNFYIDVTYNKQKVKDGKCADCGNTLKKPTHDQTVAHVLTYSTRAGTSEHQSGLCCDMHNLPATTSAFDNTPEAKWLAQNAHRFGFILRYPPNTQHITGIKHESWHFRYVGRKAATEMFLQGLTLDEYLA